MVQWTLRCRDRLLPLDTPKIMGILNITPDSFYDGGRYTTVDRALHRVEQMLEEGAEIIDIGAESTRPNATPISADEEKRRLLPVLTAIRQRFPEAILSIDTYKWEVAEEALAHGAHIINDITGGAYDPKIWTVAARYSAPYILVHFRGDPPRLATRPTYRDVVQEVYTELAERLKAVRAAGVHDVLVDVGFGFGKAPDHNWHLLKNLELFHTLGCPLLVGVSRKSMFWRKLGKRPADVLPATCAAHLYALMQGAHILRVHDVDACRQVRAVWEWLRAIRPWTPAEHSEVGQ